ncbi:MAG TPA: hypothetical protein VLT90_09380 [Terriglobales bacterium]|nr:hypothetical protein [Terriglobales bacterium]
MQILPLNRVRTFAGILLLGLLAMTARSAADPDLWWHLRTGQWIVQTGHIPHSDPFSFTRAGDPWISHEWLSEVVFYEIWRHGGVGGLILFSSVVTTAGFMLLYLRCPAKPSGAAVAVAIAALAAAPAWGARPQMFTFALASLTLWLVERGEEHPPLLLLIPPVFLLWLNLHAGFALGPALLLAIALGLLWEAASARTPWTQVRPHLTRIVLVIIACMALVPLNPSGSQLYRYPLDVLRSEGMRSFIAEWHPPDFHQLRYAPLLIIWLGLLVAMANSRSRPKARSIVPLVLTFAAAIDAVRHIPIFVLLAGPIMAVILPVAPPMKRLRQYPLAFRGAVLVLMALFAVVRWDSLFRSQSQTERDLFPAQAVAFLQSHPMPSHLFAYYDWGGYAIWKLSPEYHVFIDGRADLYGDNILREFQQALQLQEGWRQVLDSRGVEVVLVPPSSPLSQALSMDAGWGSEYRDSQAVIFLRNRAASLPIAVSEVVPSAEPERKNVYRRVPESATLRANSTGFPTWNPVEEPGCWRIRAE